MTDSKKVRAPQSHFEKEGVDIPHASEHAKKRWAESAPPTSDAVAAGDIVDQDVLDDGPERYMEWLSEDATYICADCGSLVVDGNAHDAFHAAFTRVTDYNGVQ